MKIGERYNGPPGSAHGGVAVGRFAQLVEPGPVEVRLSAPPPLGVDMDVTTEADGTVVVTGPSGRIAGVRSLDTAIVVEPFSPVTEAELDRSARDYLRGLEGNGHPFPTCFGCGPERREGDGLRQFAGPIDHDRTVAARFSVEGDGELPPWMGWAGLDCPSGWALNLADDPPAAFLLGTMSGQLVAAVHAGVDYQVRARLLGSEGRKHTTEVAMSDPDGATVGVARAVWIAVDPARM